MSSPLVSVILPTRNSAKSLPRAISSIFSQEYNNFEVIIVDGASTDETESLVKSYSDDRLYYLQEERARGVSAARNMGLNHAEGDYIAFIDDDDIWLPWKLQTQMKILEHAPANIGLLVSAYVKYDIDTAKISIPVSYADYDIIPNSNSDFVGTGLPTRWLLKREATESFDETMHAMEDLDYSIRVQDRHGIMFDNTPVAIYYNRKDSQSNQDVISGRERLVEKYGDRMSDQHIAQNLFHLATSYIEEEMFSEAEDRIRLAIELDKTNFRYHMAFLICKLRSRRAYFTLRKIHKKLNLKG